MDILRHLREFPITPKFSNVVDVPNFSNSFVNPVAYEFRISEFRRALIMRCTRREKAANTKRPETGNCALTIFFSKAEWDIVRNAAIRLQEAFEQEAMDTKL